MDEQCNVSCESSGAGQQMAKIHQPQTLLSGLAQEEENLTKKLADIRRAQELLKRNPEVEELLNIMGRSGRRLL